MKDLENIDDLFRCSLENFKVAPPKDAKEAIEKALDKHSRKKNNKGGWLLLAVLSLSIVATAMYVKGKKNDRLKTMQTNSFKAKMKENNLPEHIENKALAVIEHKKEAALNAHNYDKQSLKITPQKMVSNSVKIGSILKENIGKTSYSKKEELISNEIEKVIAVKQSLKNEGPQLNDKYSLSASKSDHNLAINAQNHENDLTLSPKNNETLVNESVELLNQTASEINATEANTVDIDTSLSEVPMDMLSLNSASSKSKGASYFITFNIGTGFNSNHFNKKNIVDASELKDSITFNKPYQSAELLFGMQQNKLSLITGISINRLNEKIQYSYLDQKVERILVDSIYIDPITNDTIVKHNVPVDTLMNYHRTNAVQTVYTSLQIPIIVNYQFVLSNKLQLDLSAGGAVQIILQSKGNYKLSPSGTLAEYQSKTSAPISGINFSALARLGLSYYIVEGTSIQLGFPVQLGLSNFYKKDYYIARSVNSVGIQMGVKYDF